MSVGRGEQRVFRGVAGTGGTGSAVGRIRVFNGDREHCDGEMLCLFEGVEEGLISRLLYRSSPAGVIVSARVISRGIIELLTCRRIPCLIVKEAFPEELCGRVALLDAESDRVIIDPDVDTLNCISLSRGRTELILRPERAERGLMIGERVGGGGLTVDTRGARGEELFEGLRDLAESRYGESVTVRLHFPRGARGREELTEDCEAVLRAAVYGDFSLQLEGYFSEGEIEDALDMLYRAFCRLESEGREFNGFLKRGILVDAPVWLMQRDPFPNADFICFDFDAITARMMGIEERELGGVELPYDAIMRLWEQYFCSFAPKRPMRARSGALIDHPVFCEWASRAGIEDIYFG